MGSKITKPENEPRQSDPDFGGPIKNRGCTDIICLIVFIAALLLYAVVSVVAYYYGNPAMLLLPQDYEGNTCGYNNEDTTPTGRDLTNKKYLHMFDITKCASISSNIAASGEIACPTTSVCVEKCPTDMFLGYYDLARQQANPSADIDYSKYICEYDVTPGTGPGEISDVETLIKTDDGQDGLCGSYYFAEEPLLGRCIPSILLDVIDVAQSSYEFVASNGSSFSLGPLDASNTGITVVTGQIMKVVGEVVAVYYAAQGVTLQVMDDLVDCYVMMIVFMGISCFSIFLCIVLMGWIARILVWTLLVAVHAALIAGIYYCYLQYARLKSADNTSEDPNNYNLEANLDYYTGLYQTWFYVGIALACLLGVVLLLTCFLFNRIRLAIQVIAEASSAARSSPFSFVIPIIPWIFQLIIVGYFLVLTVYVASYEGDPEYAVPTNSSNQSNVNSDAGDSCTPTLSYENISDGSGGYQTVASTGNCYFQQYVGQDQMVYVHAYNIFMTLWLINFVDAIGMCTLAGGFADWYWSRGSTWFLTPLFSFFRVCRYHIGSMAFGSFIIAVVQFIRIVLEYIDHKLQDKDNLVAKAVLCCCKCFFWCFEKFIKFINRNAYIMIAVYGRNFCFSAMDAFFLLLRNIARVAVLNGIAAFLMFVCKLALTAGIVFFAFLFFSGEIEQVNEWVPDLNYYFLPIIVIGVLTYIIASIFFEVYHMAVDTVFFCVLEDMERNDGTPEKPYHMSKSLQKILGKKNTFKE